MAWKDDGFSFGHNSIHEIMRQIARWYNVSVIYESVTDVHLEGISKSAKRSEVFEMLELAGEVKFKIQDKNITVSKK